jgi:S-adenosylmethionine/arginine decarboxylase-like enzyme
VASSVPDKQSIRSSVYRCERKFNMPSTSITQHDFSVGKGQIIGEEILDSARLLMFVVLDNSKISCAKTRILHMEMSHIGIHTWSVSGFSVSRFHGRSRCYSADV